MDRRSFLAACSGFVALSAGCTDRSDAPSVRLGRFTAANSDDESHEFDLRVSRNGERVHESTLTVDGRPDNTRYSEVADCTWDETPGDYTLSARVDGGEWVEQSLPMVETEDGEVPCLRAEAVYRENGPLEFLIAFTCETASQPQPDRLCAFVTDA